MRTWNGSELLPGFLAEDQWGLVTRQQAEGAGLAWTTIARLASGESVLEPSVTSSPCRRAASNEGPTYDSTERSSTGASRSTYKGCW